MSLDTATSRILNDSNDGVLTLTAKGTISFLNPCAIALLNLSADTVGLQYSDVLLSTEDNRNDAFHDFVLSAIYDSTQTQTGKIQYHLPEGQHITLQIKAHRAANDDIVLILTDVTQLELATRKAADSTATFSILIAALSVYILFYEATNFIGLSISSWGYTWIINFLIVGIFLFMLKFTSLNWDDMGLRIDNPRTTFLPAILITGAGIFILVIAKLILLQVFPSYFPSDAPFLDFSIWNQSDTFYLPTVVLQEFLARGAIQGMIARLLSGKRPELFSILIASAIFSVFHIAYGLPLMIGAALYLLLLGKVYFVQGNIWGLVIIHYFLGEAFTFLRF